VVASVLFPKLISENEEALSKSFLAESSELFKTGKLLEAIKYFFTKIWANESVHSAAAALGNISLLRQII
jgi:hypothetical protein